MGHRGMWRSHWAYGRALRLSLMRRIATTRDDVPIELTEEYARSDRLRYRMHLYRGAPC